MMDNQFSFEVLENGKQIDGRPIADPFINTSIRVRGIRAAWRVLFGGLDLVVRVNADPVTVEAVLQLDTDYLGAQWSDRRKQWNADLNRSLGDFANEIGPEVDRL